MEDGRLARLESAGKSPATNTSKSPEAKPYKPVQQPTKAV
jgi:hypothetical protein